MAYRSTMCFSCYRLPVVLQSHVCVCVTPLVRRLFSQCSGLIRRSATRLTSDLESRWDTTRRLHLPSPLGFLGGCWGWWWVREHVGVELCFRVESFRILRTLTAYVTGGAAAAQVTAETKLTWIGIANMFACPTRTARRRMCCSQSSNQLRCKT